MPLLGVDQPRQQRLSTRLPTDISLEARFRIDPTYAHRVQVHEVFRGIVVSIIQKRLVAYSPHRRVPQGVRPSAVYSDHDMMRAQAVRHQ